MLNRLLFSRAAARERPADGDTPSVASSERDLLLAVLSEMTDGILVTDREGREILTNPRWDDLFPDAAEDENQEASRRGQGVLLARSIAETLDTGKPQQLEIDLDDAHTVILTSSALPESAGAVVVAQDAAGFTKLAEIRRDFVANVSHELKTPLSAIRGFAETLADGALEDPEASGVFVDRILKQCRRLEALLSDLLTLSRLEHTAENIRSGPVALSKVLDEALEVVAERIIEKELELVDERREVPELAGDAVTLEHLCVNLLDNAIKYNRERGRIEIRLFPEARHVVLEVADTGIGIPKASIERLFERFYRVDKGRSRAEGGTGLGLAIVKHATNLHNGEVEVESELGRGSVFRIKLPLG